MNEEGNNSGFFSPLFSGNKNIQSTQPFSTVTTIVDTSEERDSARFNTRSSSPVSMYSNRQSFDSYVERENEKDYDDKYKYNSNSTFVNEEGIILSNSNSITKEQDLYHSSSLKSNDNIYSVEFSPTDNYFNHNNQPQSTSVFTTNTPIMSSGGDDHNIIYSNINNYHPPATPSTVFSINDGNDSNHNSGMDNYSVKTNDQTCNIEIISSRPDINMRNYNGGGDDFWKNLWKMNFFNNKKPTLKFWLALILIIVLLLLIVIPAAVVSSNKSSTSSSDNSSSTSSTISTGVSSSAPSLTAPITTNPSIGPTASSDTAVTPVPAPTDTGVPTAQAPSDTAVPTAPAPSDTAVPTAPAPSDTAVTPAPAPSDTAVPTPPAPTDTAVTPAPAPTDTAVTPAPAPTDPSVPPSPVT